MSTVTVTLKDGFKLPYANFQTINSTLTAFAAAIKTGHAYQTALHELMEKCKDIDYSIPSESVLILKAHGLLDQNGFVPKQVKKVVFNSFDKNQNGSPVSVNPLRNEIAKL